MKHSTFILILLLLSQVGLSQNNPDPALVGYWHNWNTTSAPFYPIDQTDSSYNFINVAFALPAVGTTYDIEFSAMGISDSIFKTQIQSLQSTGKKVLISIGGATGTVHLNDSVQRNVFVNSIGSIIDRFGFDGIDIDLEGSSVSVSGGTIANPTDARIINLIEGIKMIMGNFNSSYNKRMILTMAPETAFVQGGMSAYGGIWGAYLPIIDALRDSIEILHVQLYNTGSMFGIDGNIYTQGTADFIVSQTEALLQGFTTSGGYFAPLQESQVAIGLPACTNAAGGGYTAPMIVSDAVRYLLGTGTKPGSYTLQSTYPNIRGMMTWSINWDRASSCNGVYSFAQNFNSLFGNTTVSVMNQVSEKNTVQVFPNPITTNEILFIKSDKSIQSYSLVDAMGKVCLFSQINDFNIEINCDLTAGFYNIVLRYADDKISSHKFIIQ